MELMINILIERGRVEPVSGGASAFEDNLPPLMQHKDEGQLQIKGGSSFPALAFENPPD